MKRITKIVESKDNNRIKKLRVAAYCRVSTDNEEQIVSLEAQKAHYESYIKDNGEWEFAGLYYDEGISGTKKEKRDGLLTLIADCEQSTIDLIITKSISRFARNTTDCLELVRKLLERDIYIYFEKEDLNTGSMESELMLSILSGLAESESVSISENEKWSIRKRFQNGTYVISYPPFGYANVDGKMVIVPEEAEVVRQIFAATLAGKGSYLIAKDLNMRGIPTKRGSKWSAGTVKGMLGNEKYTGDAVFQKTYTDSSFNRHANRGECDQYLVHNHHEPIISHEIFEKAEKVLRQRGSEKGVRKQDGKYQSRYAFSGKIKCGECGSNFKRRTHYKPSGSYIAWCCSVHIENAKECTMKYIRDEDIKTAFITMMNKLHYGSDFVLKPLLYSVRTMNRAESLEHIYELETALDKNLEQKHLLAELVAKGYLDQSVYQQAMVDLKRNTESLRREKDNLTKVAGNELVICEEVKELMKFLNREGLMREYDEEVFLRFVNQIMVYSRKEIGFELKCGLILKERLVK